MYAHTLIYILYISKHILLYTYYISLCVINIYKGMGSALRQARGIFNGVAVLNDFHRSASIPGMRSGDIQRNHCIPRKLRTSFRSGSLTYIQLLFFLLYT